MSLFKKPVLHDNKRRGRKRRSTRKRQQIAPPNPYKRRVPVQVCPDTKLDVDTFEPDYVSISEWVDALSSVLRVDQFTVADTKKCIGFKLLDMRSEDSIANEKTDMNINKRQVLKNMFNSSAVSHQSSLHKGHMKQNATDLMEMYKTRRSWYHQKKSR